jgi:hypothetical protein
VTTPEFGVVLKVCNEADHSDRWVHCHVKQNHAKVDYNFIHQRLENEKKTPKYGIRTNPVSVRGSPFPSPPFSLLVLLLNDVPISPRVYCLREIIRYRKR